MDFCSVGDTTDTSIAKKKITCTSHSMKIPMAKITGKLAVQTTAPPNTKGRSRRENIALMGHKTI